MTHSSEVDTGLADYEIQGELGRGGFGQVLLARHRILGRLVAVKQISPAAMHDDDAVARFRREAALLAALDHPGIVRVYDFRTGPAGAVLILEYVPGQSLRQALDRGPMPVPRALSVLADVAAALAAAAARGIVHRDVKPANVFLLPDSRAKLGDFGIARAADTRLFRTADGMLTGTPAYLPPECLLPEYEPHGHGDDYSFAVMAYEMLVGVLPFQGEGLVLLGQHGHRAPAAPELHRPGFPPAATEALLAGLAKEPAGRLPAVALATRLAAVPEGDWPPPAAHRPVGDDTTQVDPLPRTTLGAPRPGVPAARRRWRSPAQLALLAIGAAIVAVVVAVVLVVRAGPGRLQVEGMALEVTPSVGQCPRADFEFVAVVRTNGASGQLRLQWTRPDGRRTDVLSVAVADGQRRAQARLEFTVTGGGPLTGTATLAVLGPDRLTSAPAPISYRCP